MSAFENLTLLAKQLFAGLVRVGSPPGVPGASSTIRALYGSPEGVVTGIAGDTVFQVDGPAIWMLTGSRTSFHKTGWVRVASTGGGGGSGDFTPYGLRLTAISGYGAVDTAVMLFTTAPATDDFGLPTSDWLVQTNDPNTGSTFQIVREGNYEVSLNTPTNNQNPGESSFTGITLDAQLDPALLTAPPIFGVFPEVQAGAADEDAGFPSTLTCAVSIPIPQSEIDAGRGIIRFQNTPGQPLVNALVGFIIRRVGPCILP
jgi:hypothetical protein